MDKKELEEKTRAGYKHLRHSSLGIELAMWIILGILLGFWIESRWEVAPWGVLGGLMLGILGGARSLYRTLKEMQRELEKSEDE